MQLPVHYTTLIWMHRCQVEQPVQEQLWTSEPWLSRAVMSTGPPTRAICKDWGWLETPSPEVLGGDHSNPYTNKL